MRDSRDIRDDEFRVLGKPVSHGLPDDTKRRNRLVSIVSLILVIGIGVLAILFWPKNKVDDKEEEGLFEEVPQVKVVEKEANETKEGLLGAKATDPFTEKIDTVINDVQLSLYIPHNAVPELVVGVPDYKDKSIILAAQAADIRKDNKKILGAFVLKGEPLAGGVSKKGFCAIIDSVVTIGTGKNSPLFEEATDKGGYFFRQYPLVDNGNLVENKIKNKSIRKALCSRKGQVFVAISETNESFHDFAQALVDIEVENAIYLVGSHLSFGWYVNAEGETTLFVPDDERVKYDNENFIVWR